MVAVPAGQEVSMVQWVSKPEIMRYCERWWLPSRQTSWVWGTACCFHENGRSNNLFIWLRYCRVLNTCLLQSVWSNNLVASHPPRTTVLKSNREKYEFTVMQGLFTPYKPESVSQGAKWYTSGTTIWLIWKGYWNKHARMMWTKERSPIEPLLWSKGFIRILVISLNLFFHFVLSFFPSITLLLLLPYMALNYPAHIAPLREIVALKNEYFFRIIMDDSMGVGTLGKTGRGTCEYWDVPTTAIDVLTSSMSHALGSIGGFCAGARTVVFHQVL